MAKYTNKVSTSVGRPGRAKQWACGAQASQTQSILACFVCECLHFLNFSSLCLETSE